MDHLNFKVSDNQKFDYLWTLLNPNCNEENNWVVEYSICDIYDEYAVVYNYAEGIFERVYYTKDDATDSVSIDKKERCYILDVTESEKKALDTLRVLNGSTFELVDEKFAEIENLNNQISENSTKVEELNLTISTLTMERDEANSQKDEYVAKFTEANEMAQTLAAENIQLTNERDALVTYKKNVEDEAKQAVISSYADSLDSEIIDKYTNDRDQYTVEELDIKLTYEQKKAHPELFSQKLPKPAFIPKDDNNGATGLEAILSKYEKR